MRKSIRAWRFVKTLGASVVLLCLVLTQKTYAEDWVYTVRKGDTLWDLCIEYTVRKNCWMEIGPYNEVDFPPSLAPGTRIRFPTAWLKNRPQEVEVIFLRGDVQIAENTETRAATLNEHLSTGIKILTGDDASATLLFADGTTLVMEENSELNLDTLSQHGEAGMVDSRLRLLKGKINSKVTKREPRSRFRVSTPSSVAAVRGTEFSVSADSEATRGSVYEGEIAMESLSDSADSKSVQQGFGIVAKKGEALPEPVKLLPAPTLADDFKTNQSLPTKVLWQSAKGTKHTILQVLADAENDELLLKQQTDARELVLNGLADDCYRLQLNSVDSAGIVGMPAKTRLCVYSAPKDLLAKRISKNEIELSWHYDGTEKVFMVDAASDAEFSTVLSSSITEEKRISLQLPKQKQLYFRVQTLNAKEEALATSESIALQEKSDAWVLLYIFLPLLLAL